MAPPNPPSGLSATLVTAKQINLTWTDNSTTETGFKLERSINGVDFTALATVAANKQAYTDTTTLGGRICTYRVKAYNSTGDSLYSATVTVVTPATATEAPSSLAATVLSSSAIKLTWKDNATDEPGFIIERSLDGGAL